MHLYSAWLVLSSRYNKATSTSNSCSIWILMKVDKGIIPVHVHRAGKRSKMSTHRFLLDVKYPLTNAYKIHQYQLSSIYIQVRKREKRVATNIHKYFGDYKGYKVKFLPNAWFG